MTAAPPTEYRCPGESYTISRALHLGRLGSFYAPCRECPHRDDTLALPHNLVTQIAAVSQEPRNDLFFAEGVAGVCENQFRPSHARHFAAAFGVDLRQSPGAERLSPHVALAGDGRATTPEFIAAVAEGLRWAGCDVVDLGVGTVGSLALALDHLQTDGGLYVGNPAGEPHCAGLKFWGRCGRPYSLAGGLDRLRQLAEQPLARPSRRAGTLERCDVRERYRACLFERYHALRPLRIVLDTSCQPLLDHLAVLTTHVSCEVLPTRAIPPDAKREPRKGTSGPLAGIGSTWLARRLQAVAHQVVAQRAHFGMWIDGDGDVCHLIDEWGQRVANEAVVALLATWLQRGETSRAAVVEDAVSQQLADGMKFGGSKVVRAAPQREAMFDAMQISRAIIGGGTSGRIWFGGQRVHNDALRVLTELFCLLSEGDTPLSALVAA